MQSTQINQTVGCARFVHNNCLSTRQDYYKETGKSLSGDAYKKNYLNPMKQTCLRYGKAFESRYFNAE